MKQLTISGRIISGRWITLCLLASIAFCGFGSDDKEREDEKKNPIPENLEKSLFSWTRTFAEVLELIQSKHFQPQYIDSAFSQALDTLLSTMDPHSGLLDAKSYRHMLESTNGEFFGIGVVIDNSRKTRDRYIIIVDTIPDGPADKEGLKPLDKIIEVNDMQIEGMTTEEAISKIKGEKGSKVNLKIVREGQAEPISFEITRDTVKEQNSLSFEIRDQNIHYISLLTFSQNAMKQIETILKKSREKDYKGIIFDLRNNSGGLLSAVIEIVGLFVKKGSTVVTTKNKEGHETERYVTKRTPIAAHHVPIFVMINNYTASAAEILAGALQVHSEKLNGNKLCAFLVGTRSFGKGSVQEVIPISNDCAAKITTSLYYLPDGKTIQGVGIEPDIIVERCMPPSEHMQWFTKHYGREEALDHYLRAPENRKAEEERKEEEKKKEAEKKKKKNEPLRHIERAKEMLQNDNQLRTTITAINLLHTFKETDEKAASDRSQALAFLKKNITSGPSLDIVELKQD